MKTLADNAKFAAYLKQTEANIERMKREGTWIELGEKPAPTCAFCNDMGFVFANVEADHPMYKREIHCPRCELGQRRAWESYSKLLSDSRLPDYFQDKTLDTWLELTPQERAGKELAYAAAVAFVDAAPTKALMLRSALYRSAGLPFDGKEYVANSIVFQSDVGYGKTGLAAGIIHGLAARGVVSAYTRVQALIQDIQRTYQDGYVGPTRQDIVFELKTARVLVLDEFNMSSVSPHSEDVLQEIVRHRHGYALPTVITCNWSQEQIRGAWGDWIADVLLEMSHWIPLDGFKLRQSSPLNTVPAKTLPLREVQR